MNLTIDDLLRIIGMKEAEIIALRSMNAQLQEQLKKAAPKPTKEKPPDYELDKYRLNKSPK